MMENTREVSCLTFISYEDDEDSPKHNNFMEKYEICLSWMQCARCDDDGNNSISNNNNGHLAHGEKREKRTQKSDSLILSC